MIYDKIPIILLSKIASLSEDSTNCHIASYILSNLDTARLETISELARSCNVANSSISRFCRDIGLSDFFELKELLEGTQLQFDQASVNDTPEGRAREHANQLTSSIVNVADSLDYKSIGELAKDLKRYQKVTAFGLLKAETAAINLQADLLMMKKFIRTKLAYDEQLKFINEADDTDLIIVFSYTGTYFAEGLKYLNHKKKPRIYLISGDKETKAHPMIYKKISFASPQNQISHPYQLLFTSSIISQEYSLLQ